MSMIRGSPGGVSDDWQALLDSSYHHLCRSVRPEAFFSWLRTKGVFTRSDQEEVENKYMTTVMKSGHLIDIIKTKGRHGFIAFMEVVEYIYPDTYYLLTGKQPGKPPPEFEPNAFIGESVVREKRGPALSAEILGQMGELVNVLSQDNALKKEELAKLQKFVTQLQEENRGMCQENRSILQKFKDAQEEIDQFKQKLNVLHSKHDHDTKERKVLLSECERLRELKDKYTEENQQLRKERDDLDCKFQLSEREIHRSQTCRLPCTSSREQMRLNSPKLTLDRKPLLTKSADCRESEEEPNLKVADADSQFQKQTSEANDEHLNKQLELLLEEQEEKSKEWQSKHTMLQERYDYVLVNLEEVKAERNQMRDQLEDLQSMYDKDRMENERLVADCNKYQERFCNMEDQMVLLKQEIDQLQSMQQSSVPSPNGCPPVNTGDGTNGVPEPKSFPFGRGITSDSSGKSQTGNSRQLEVIAQSPGLCPDLKRQVVISNKPRRQHSISNA